MAEHDLVLLGELGRLLQHLDAAASFRPRSGRLAGEDAERRVIRPAQIFAAQNGRHLDGPFVAFDRGLANAGIGADRIGSGADAR